MKFESIGIQSNRWIGWKKDLAGKSSISRGNCPGNERGESWRTRENIKASIKLIETKGNLNFREMHRNRRIACAALSTVFPYNHGTRAYFENQVLRWRRKCQKTFFLEPAARNVIRTLSRLKAVTLIRWSTSLEYVFVLRKVSTLFS